MVVYDYCSTGHLTYHLSYTRNSIRFAHKPARVINGYIPETSQPFDTRGLVRPRCPLPAGFRPHSVNAAQCKPFVWLPFQKHTGSILVPNQIAPRIGPPRFTISTNPVVQVHPHVRCQPARLRPAYSHVVDAAAHAASDTRQVKCFRGCVNQPVRYRTRVPFRNISHLAARLTHFAFVRLLRLSSERHSIAPAGSHSQGKPLYPPGCARRSRMEYAEGLSHGWHSTGSKGLRGDSQG